jgi:hypothetical protein
MRRVEVEHWAITVADRVKAHKPLEDSRVELKAGWPDAVDAARRIAGHANAAHGDPILWIIGLDEKRGVIGATANDLAKWYPQVQAQFDGIAPGMEDFVVPYDGQTLVALLFETSGAPFVVHNPVFGKTGGGSVSRETPWREGTSIRSATRTDLLRLLVPLQRLPEVEVLEARISHVVENGRSGFNLWASHYFTPHSSERVIILAHRCQGGLQIQPSGESLPFNELILRALRPDEGPRTGSVRSTDREVIIVGSGEVILEASAHADRHIEPVDGIELSVECRPAFADAALVIRQPVPKDPPTASSSAEFHFWIKSPYE